MTSVDISPILHYNSVLQYEMQRFTGIHKQLCSNGMQKKEQFNTQNAYTCPNLNRCCQQKHQTKTKKDAQKLENNQKTCNQFQRWRLFTTRKGARTPELCYSWIWLIKSEIIPDEVHLFYIVCLTNFPETQLSGSAHTVLLANLIKRAESFLLRMIMWQVVIGLLLCHAVVRHACT